jgi:hypothetical protein
MDVEKIEAFCLILKLFNDPDAFNLGELRALESTLKNMDAGFTLDAYPIIAGDSAMTATLRT